MKWTVYTRDESVMPAIEGPDLQQYVSKDDALQQAWELMYGRTRRPRMTILRIEGPKGESRAEGRKITIGEKSTV